MDRKTLFEQIINSKKYYIPTYIYYGKKCPYVILDSKISNQFASYLLIEKDLNLVENFLNQILSIPYKEKYNVIKQSLWYSSIITYGKCFTNSEYRKVTLNENHIFKNDINNLINFHKDFMKLRNNFIAHASDMTQENVLLILNLNPDLKEKKRINISSCLGYLTDFSNNDVIKFIELVKYLNNEVNNKIKKIFEKLISEIDSGDFNEIYKKATFPTD